MCVETAGENRLQIAAQAGGNLTPSATSSTRLSDRQSKLEIRDPQGPVAWGGSRLRGSHSQSRHQRRAKRRPGGVLLEGLEASTVEGGPHEIWHGPDLPADRIDRGRRRGRVSCAGEGTSRQSRVPRKSFAKRSTQLRPKGHPLLWRSAGGERAEKGTTLAKREPTFAAPPQSPGEPQPLEKPIHRRRNPYGVVGRAPPGRGGIRKLIRLVLGSPMVRICTIARGPQASTTPKSHKTSILGRVARHLK